MKKTGKILLGLGAVALAYLGYKYFKKEKKTILETMSKEDEVLEDIGVDPQYVKDQMIPEEDDYNLVKPLFLAAYGGNEFETSSVVDCLFRDDNDPVVYIMQSCRRNKQKNEEIHNLDIHLEIPDFNESSFKMRDFVMGGRKLAKELWSNVVKFVEEPYTSLCGFMVLELKELGKEGTVQKTFKIPEMLYQSNPKFTEGSRSNGLEEFIRGYREKSEDVIAELEKIPQWIADIFPDKDYELMIPVKMYLTYKISFNIASPSSEPGLNKLGIDLKSGIDALKYIVDEFSIESSHWDWKKHKTAPKMKWNKLVFNAPNPEDGRWSFLHYYDKDEDGNVIVDDFEWTH